MVLPIRRVCLLVVLLSCASVALAQTPSKSAEGDEGSVIEQSRTVERFEADGTGRRETYVRVKAVSDAGVQQWGQLIIGYNAATEKIDISFVRVKKPDGTVIETPGSAVQDLTSPVQRVAPVYTDFRQKHVTVQSLRPGDTLEFSVVTTRVAALAPGEFWTEYSFNDDAIVLDEQYDIDVPAARRVILKVRPGFDPATKEANGRRVYHWSHSHPVRDDEDTDEKKKKKQPSDEPEYAAIRLTTFQNWESVGRWFGGMEAASRQPTPEVKAKARELIAGKTTDVQKLEALYDYVSKNFRYVSLSLGIGRYQPRGAASVLHDAYGDCKDKHTLLASLIDAVGLHASAVLINSQVKIDPDFPSPSQFDHVITRAEAGGKALWLDSTLEVAPFGHLIFPLRDKQALVVSSAPHLERTPAESPVRMTVRTAIDASLNEEGTLAADVAMTFRGDAEVGARAGFRAAPAAQWKTIVERIAAQASLDGKVSNVQVSNPEATREPFSIAFHVEVPAYANWEARDTQLTLPLMGKPSTVDPPESGKIALGPTGDLTYTLRLTLPAAARPRAPVPVSVSRDYAAYRSSYAVANHVLSVERTLSLNKAEIEESRRDDYLAFVGVLNSDGRQRVTVDASRIAAVSASASPSGEAKTLSQRGYDALIAADYEQAIALFERTVQLEPKDKTAWTNLGRAYVGVHRIEDAIGAYKKQIEVNPYDTVAYTYLGMAYVQQRRYADAEAAYLRQLEINPLDQYARADLGVMYNEQRQWDKAAASLEKAVSVAPNVPSYQVQLGKAYLNLKQADKALAAFDKAAELSPTPLVWNDVAYELSLARVDLDRAQRYAESAVSTIVAMSRNVDVNHADAAALYTVTALASYWDTLGWVWFAKGDTAKAGAYVTAAWNLSQHPEVGDHLGQIYTRQGRRDAATAAYARALTGNRPDPSVREHLSALVGADRVDAALAAHRDDLVKARTVAIGKGPSGKRADAMLVFAAPGRVDSVRLLDADADMQPLVPQIQKLTVTGMFPDNDPERLLRRMTVVCDAHGECTGTLILPADARPAK
jgi:tetratricopeptide (TPR) repeat protein/transglutaminase-like putative cysteine protease